MKFISAIVFLLSYLNCYGQITTKSELCGFRNASYLNRPNMNRQVLEKKYRSSYQRTVQSFHEKSLWPQKVYKIPAVVHIIHSGEALGTEENPTDDEILSLIGDANKNFRHSYQGASGYDNPYYGVDTQIELHLVQRDLKGFPVSGILRYFNPEMASNNDFNELNDYILKEIVWHPLLVCNLVIVNDMSYCGISMGYDAYTLYASHCLSPELVNHEIGHYLDLLHSFEFIKDCNNTDCLTDNDRICDTPPSFSRMACQETNSCNSDENDTSPNNPYRPVALGGMGDQTDMNINYMSYADYECQESFTIGQKVRMCNFIEEQLNILMAQQHLILENPGVVQIHHLQKFETNNEQGFIQNTTATITGNFPDTYINQESIKICFETRGTYFNPGEMLQIFDEDGNLVGVKGFVPDPEICIQVAEFCINITSQKYESWIENNGIDFLFKPIGDIVSSECTLTWSNTVRISLLIPTYLCDKEEILITELVEDHSAFVSKGHIISTARVPPAFETLFRARQEIQLNPGFQVDENAVFEAVIGPCIEN